MKGRKVSAMTLALLLTSMLMLASRVQPVRAQGTIYIRADGSIEGTTDILTVDNITYTFTNNIYGEIVVERNNIVVDGTGYTVQGTGNGTGIYLLGRNNVTVKNTEIRAFDRGIRLEDSSNNTISTNNVTNNEFGIVFYDSSSENTLRHNHASDNRYNLGIFTASVSGYIQDIDDSNTVNGKPVYYWADRQDMAVPLDAGYVVLVNCTCITVENLNLTNNMQGVALAFTTNSTITKNNITNNFDGIRLDYSSNNNVISGNNITANTCYGIRFFYDPSKNAMSMNKVVNNEYGSQMVGPPCNGTICGNNITSNGSGIRLDYSSNNTISANNVANNPEEGIGLYGSSSGNTVSGNNIANNDYGIWFYDSYGNWIYHNNFIGNTPQVYPSFELNSWDAGYPSGGNYWSPTWLYHGTDIYSGLYQNETGSDGIGDAPYVEDKYPLIGMFNRYNVTYFTSPIVPHAYNVTVISNSTISDFVAPIWIEHPEVIFLVFNVTGEQGSTGFCRVSFPTAMMNGTYHIFVNGTEIPYTLLPCSDADYSYLYFNYIHSTKEITIIPEFPSFLILPILFIATLLAIMVHKKGVRTNHSKTERAE
jgi:parallel beta-helix repeat protein